MLPPLYRSSLHYQSNFTSAIISGDMLSTQILSEYHNFKFHVERRHAAMPPAPNHSIWIPIPPILLKFGRHKVEAYIPLDLTAACRFSTAVRSSKLKAWKHTLVNLIQKQEQILSSRAAAMMWEWSNPRLYAQIRSNELHVQYLYNPDSECQIIDQ